MLSLKHLWKPASCFLCTLSLFFASCSESTVTNDKLNSGKGNIEGYISKYSRTDISSADIDGVLVLDCGIDHNNLGTTEPTNGASSHALFVDKSFFDTIRTNLVVTMNGQQLADPYSSGLMSSFVSEPAQNPNSVEWVITNLNNQPLHILDAPLQRIDFPPSLKAGDTLSLGGFSLNYSADSSIREISVDIIFDIGLSRYFLGDTRDDYPPFITKKVSNTGTINFTASELSALRRGYYAIGIEYKRMDVFNGGGRRILLPKSYSNSIPLVLQ